ncbi:MAG: signal peptidase I [Deltaproteobacteria bacterium]|nr:signal peptidase I [Deltaproteobacteria bacterium]
MQKKKVIRETIEAIVVALILALTIRTFVIQAFKIPSSSMEPTLLIGDHILVNKFIYGIPVPFTDIKLVPFTKPERWDVVVFKFPVDKSKDYIKRVVAIEGETIEIKDKKILINGKDVADPYGVHRDPDIFTGEARHRDNFGPYTVPDNSIFVMGDNRDSSYDSRFWGIVKLEEIRGKAFIIYWSWNSNEHWMRFDRLTKWIR